MLASVYCIVSIIANTCFYANMAAMTLLLAWVCWDRRPGGLVGPTPTRSKHRRWVSATLSLFSSLTSRLGREDATQFPTGQNKKETNVWQRQISFANLWHMNIHVKHELIKLWESNIHIDGLLDSSGLCQKKKESVKITVVIRPAEIRC